MKKRNNAFTLTELLIVITIIGVMATLILPRYFPQTEKSRTVEAMQILSSLRQGEIAHFAQNGRYLTVNTGIANSFEQLGLEAPTSRYFFYRVEVDNSNPPVFLAIATRNEFQNPSASYKNKNVLLDQDGRWNSCIRASLNAWCVDLHPLVEPN
jgi:prepilin-type N-terminal cleavage/methylation domain-containing protein